MDMNVPSKLACEDLPRELQVGLQAIQPTMGGLTNRSWKLQRDSGNCIWRPHSSLLTDLGISRASEYKVLQFLKEQSFAPNVVYYSKQGIANQWLDGQPLFVSPSHQQMAELMKRYHCLNIDDELGLPKFDYVSKINTYWNAIDPSNRFDQLTALFEFANSASSAVFEEQSLSLLHCDLGYYNLINTGEQTAIIDWEYACVGDPLVDVVLTAMACRYRLDSFVTSYYQNMDVDLDLQIERAYELRFRFEIMSALWFVVCYQYNSDVSYLNEAVEMASALCNSDHCFSS